MGNLGGRFNVRKTMARVAAITVVVSLLAACGSSTEDEAEASAPDVSVSAAPTEISSAPPSPPPAAEIPEIDISEDDMMSAMASLPPIEPMDSNPVINDGEYDPKLVPATDDKIVGIAEQLGITLKKAVIEGAPDDLSYSLYMADVGTECLLTVSHMYSGKENLWSASISSRRHRYMGINGGDTGDLPKQGSAITVAELAEQLSGGFVKKACSTVPSNTNNLVPREGMLVFMMTVPAS